MELKKIPQIILTSKEIDRLYFYLSKTIESADRLAKRSDGLGLRDIGELAEVLPVIKDLVVRARCELILSVHPLRHLPGSDEVRAKLKKPLD